MALQSCGAISLSQIKSELNSTSNSLRTLSSLAGKSTPDSFSEFYGYSFSQAYTISAQGFGDSTGACQEGPNSETIVVYGAATGWANDLLLYNDSSLTESFDGQDQWYFEFGTGTSGTISPSGRVGNVTACGGEG